MKGNRVDEKFEDLNQWPIPIMKAGDYGKSIDGRWRCIPPDTDLLGNIDNHTITEHEDGTITVTPSILIKRYDAEWHGYLTKGVWSIA